MTIISWHREKRRSTFIIKTHACIMCFSSQIIKWLQIKGQNTVFSQRDEIVLFNLPDDMKARGGEHFCARGNIVGRP